MTSYIKTKVQGGKGNRSSVCHVVMAMSVWLEDASSAHSPTLDLVLTPCFHRSLFKRHFNGFHCSDTDSRFSCFRLNSSACDLPPALVITEQRNTSDGSKLVLRRVHFTSTDSAVQTQRSPLVLRSTINRKQTPGHVTITLQGLQPTGPRSETMSSTHRAQLLSAIKDCKIRSAH